MKNTPTDFNEIKNQLNSKILNILQDLLPNGQKQGLEYLAYNPKRIDKKLGSFKINLATGKWADFATNHKGGDIISLYAYVKNIQQLQAAKELKKIYLGGSNNE